MRFLKLTFHSVTSDTLLETWHFFSPQNPIYTIIAEEGKLCFSFVAFTSSFVTPAAAQGLKRSEDSQVPQAEPKYLCWTCAVWEGGGLGVSHTSPLTVQGNLRNGHPCCVGRWVRSSQAYWDGIKMPRGRKICPGMTSIWTGQETPAANISRGLRVAGSSQQHPGV